MLLRTDWGPGVNGLGAGESRVKNTLAELIFAPRGNDKRRIFEVEINVLSFPQKFWGWQKTVLEPAKNGSQNRSSPGFSRARE